MYKLKAILVFILLVGLSSCMQKETNGDPEVNIIVIVVDQLSAEVMSNAGCEWVDTPSMDKLAENGVKFTNAYTSFPLCSPRLPNAALFVSPCRTRSNTSWPAGPANS